MADDVKIQTFSAPLDCITTGDGDDARHDFALDVTSGNVVLFCKSCGSTWLHHPALNVWKPVLFEKGQRTETHPPYVVIS